jgi:Cu(I)/Ag(I) efflux system membrane fusion protein
MTMEFKVANNALLSGLTPGAAVAFEFVERAPGEWVITAIKPGAKTGTGAVGAPVVNPHAGH